MITIKKEDYLRLLEHAVAQLPNEACGLLAGRQEASGKVVEQVYLLRNLDESPEHFRIDPGEQLQALRDAREKSLVLLGNFHSHPQTPSRPSEEDKRLARDPAASYLILSLADRNAPVLKSFRVVGGVAEQERLVLVESPAACDCQG